MQMQQAALGMYRIVGKIGEGGMGTVYLGEHTLLGRRAAIKVLLPSLSANEEVVGRFFNEARAVSLIADPGIVQIFDFGHAADGSAFIVMELLDGEPMDRRIERAGAFGLLECLRLMRLICSSLAAAHARGIVHRDVKPENIFLVGDAGVTGGERPKLLDFGIAKLSGEMPGKLKTRTGQVIGTPAYMSPEQCRGAGDVDHRSDIYAVACVMFAMLTGRPPFDGETSGEQIAAHLREPPPLASSRVPALPGVIDEILQRCLHKSPADRFASMAGLVDALDAAEQLVQRSSAATLAMPPSRCFARSLPAPSPEIQPSMVSPARDPAWSTPSPPRAVQPGQPGPTTLFHASGQAAARVSALRRWKRRSSAAAVGAALVVAGVAITVSRGGLFSHPAPPPAGDASAQAHVAASDARPQVTPSDAAIADVQAAPDTAAATGRSVADTGALASTPDAGVRDAAVAVRPPDAAMPPSRPPPHRTSTTGKHPRLPGTGDKHANQSTAPSPPILDRGD